MQNLAGLKKSAENFLDSDSGYATATKVVFAILLIAGALSVAAVAPNMFVAFKKLKRPNKYSDKQLEAAYYGLKRRGLVDVIKEEGNSVTIKLNYKNKAKFRKFSLDMLSIPKLKKWDKKWRVVIFDVPIRHNKARRAMVQKLKELGLYQLQKSVWVYPFPCEDEILFTANFFNADRFVNLLVVENITDDHKIKRFFNLV